MSVYSLYYNNSNQRLTNNVIMHALITNKSNYQQRKLLVSVEKQLLLVKSPAHRVCDALRSARRMCQSVSLAGVCAAVSTFPAEIRSICDVRKNGDVAVSSAWKCKNLAPYSTICRWAGKEVGCIPIWRLLRPAGAYFSLVSISNQINTHTHTVTRERSACSGQL